MSTFENTLKRLTEQRTKHENQIAAIKQFESLLQGLECTPSAGIINLPVEATFQVHLQSSSPSEFPTKAIGRSLSKTYERALTLWEEKNGAVSPQPNVAEVFIAVSEGELLTVVSPSDAAKIVSNETCKTFSPDQFGFDSRLIEDVGRIVWTKDERLPGCHASSETTSDSSVSENLVIADVAS